MSRTLVPVLLAAILALPSASAFAQFFPLGPQGGPDISRAGRATDTDVETCQGAAGGSRMRSNCENRPRPSVVQQAAKVRLPPALPAAPLCEATTLTEYLQRNTVARVNGSIDVKSCPAGSAGTYDVVLRLKDDSGQIKPIEFKAEWRSADSEDVAFSADYPIGDNVELVNVRLRNLRCTCADALAEPAPAGHDATPPERQEE